MRETRKENEKVKKRGIVTLDSHNLVRVSEVREEILFWRRREMNFFDGEKNETWIGKERKGIFIYIKLCIPLCFSFPFCLCELLFKICTILTNGSLKEILNISLKRIAANQQLVSLPYYFISLFRFFFWTLLTWTRRIRQLPLDSSIHFMI